MPKLIITVGVSASGKSTWANSQEGFAIICRDNIRGVLFPEYHNGEYKMTNAKESKVSEAASNQWLVALHQGRNVIIADTNLNPKYRELWVQRGEDAGYEVEFKDFPISLEEAWNRDQKRSVYSVGRDVISQQYKMWNEYIGRKRYTPNESLTKAIIVDIDGTIASRHNRSPFEWDKVGQDKPRSFIIDLIKLYINHYVFDEIVFVSGRDSVCRHETLKWISKYFNIPIYNITLFMRKEGDQRKDTIVKEEIFWDNIADHYNVLAVFDDRPCVVEMWYDIGITNVICVADQRTRF